jgi:hypothetical protein
VGIMVLAHYWGKTGLYSFASAEDEVTREALIIVGDEKRCQAILSPNILSIRSRFLGRLKFLPF